MIEETLVRHKILVLSNAIEAASISRSFCGPPSDRSVEGCVQGA